jgi:hypothetical protein
MSLRQSIYKQLPPWARPDFPMLNYMIQSSERRRSRIVRWVILIGTAAVLVAVTYASTLAYQDNHPLGGVSAQTPLVYGVLYFPLLAVQFGILVLSLMLTSTMVSSEEARGAWESLRITSHGAEMAVRSRWAAVFYQLRWLLLLIMLPRLVFVGMMLADLTDYQGYHLDLYITGIRPEVSVEAAVILLAALMTAVLLLPLIAVGFNAALGLMIATKYRRRLVGALVQLIVLVFETVVFVLAIWLGQMVLRGDATSTVYTHLSSQGKWLSLWMMAVMGDQSLRFMDLRTTFQSWSDVDYGILLGVALLATVLIAAALIQVMLWIAAKRASKPGAE